MLDALRYPISPPRLPRAPPPNLELRAYQLKPTIRATRAHWLLDRKPQLSNWTSAFLTRVCRTIEEQIEMPVKMEGQLAASWMNPFESLSRYSVFATIALDAQDCVACLEIDAITLGRIFGNGRSLIEDLDRPITLTDSERKKLIKLLLRCIDNWRQVFQDKCLFFPRVLGVVIDRREVLQQLDCRRRHVAINIRTNFMGERGAMRLIVPTQAIERVCHRLDEPSLPELPDCLGKTKINVSLVSGPCLFSKSAETIAINDFLNIEQLTPEGGCTTGTAFLKTKHFELEGRLSNKGFTLQTSRTRTHFEEKQSLMQLFSANLPVDIEVELTRLALPLSEIARLKPGAVLPLHINSSQPIFLRAGDRVIAKAELVEIDGELGARVISLTP